MASNDDTILIVFVTLTLFYGSILLVALLRTFRLFRYTEEWKVSKILYCAVLVEVLLRTICFAVICGQQKDMESTLLFLLLSLPDTIFIITYLTLFWEMLTIHYQAHIVFENQHKLLEELSKPPHKTTISIFVAVILVSLIIIQITLYILLLSDSIGGAAISLEISVMNFVIPTIVLVCMLILQIKLSGVPHKSKVWKLRLKRMNLVTLFWTLGRFIRGVLDVLESYSLHSITNELTDDNDVDIVGVLVLIAVLTVSEVMCILIILDYGFISVFVFSQDDDEVVRRTTIKKRLTIGAEEDKPLNTTDSMTVFTATFISPEDFEFKEVTVISEIEGKDKSFGKLYRVNFKGEEACMRKIEFPRLSGYILEEFKLEIEKLKSMTDDHLVPIIGTCIENSTIGLLTPLYANSSLYNLLHVQQVALSYQVKFQIIRDIAICFERLHDKKNVHGHLTSHNLLLDSHRRVYLSDVGLIKLKKYAGIVLGYTNKNAWSSPELLKEKCLTGIKISPSDDIYSFGMVVWEVMTGQVPFPGYTRNQLMNKVAVESYRPKLPQDLPEEISTLILSCWNTDPQSRPSFTLIVQTLNRQGGIN